MNYIHTILIIGKVSLSLCLIVGIHELGHMLFAKLFKMRVEQYVIGFPPKIFKFKYGQTEYGIGAIPLGGYVKIAGVVDESMDQAHIKQPPKPWEFRSKPKIQQLIVMLGGIFFNLISALIIYTCLLSIQGTPYLPKDELNKHGIHPTQIGLQVGFKVGDKVLTKNGQEYTHFSELQANLSEGAEYEVVREGEGVKIHVDKSVIERLKREKKHLITPLNPYKIGSILPKSSAQKAGLQKDDILLSINNQPVQYIQNLTTTAKAYAGQKVTLTYKRAGKILTTQLQLDKEGKMGITAVSTLQYNYQSIPPLKAFIGSIYRVSHIITSQVKGLKQLITGKTAPSKAVSGPIGIAKKIASSHDAYSFWHIIAIISLIIAFMNLLPIPGLDGGHALIILCEMITRRKLPYTWHIRLQKIGMSILLTLMLFAIFNDLRKFL